MRETRPRTGDAMLQRAGRYQTTHHPLPPGPCFFSRLLLLSDGGAHGTLPVLGRVKASRRHHHHPGKKRRQNLMETTSRIVGWASKSKTFPEATLFNPFLVVPERTMPGDTPPTPTPTPQPFITRENVNVTCLYQLTLPVGPRGRYPVSGIPRVCVCVSVVRLPLPNCLGNRYTAPVIRREAPELPTTKSLITGVNPSAGHLRADNCWLLQSIATPWCLETSLSGSATSFYPNTPHHFA